MVSELTPIHPSPAVPNVKKIRRDRRRNNNADKRERAAGDDLFADKSSQQNDEPAQHVDEIV